MINHQSRTSPEVHGRGLRFAAVLGVVAAVLYNSWPLGLLLDPAGLRGTYISVLEMPARPHAHLFIACDLAAGLLAGLAGLALRRRDPVLATGLVVFGIGNVLEASVPLEASCAPSVAACGIAPGQVFAPHDLASLLSVAGLALALWTLRDHGAAMDWVIGLWVVTGLVMVVSVVVARWTLVSQASFLVGCGIALAAVPLALLRDTRREPSPVTAGGRALSPCPGGAEDTWR